MAEPDFDQIARRVITIADPDAEDYQPQDDLDRQAIAQTIEYVAEQLRQAWNARGAADIYFVEGWSFVPGDCAYVEAVTGPDAIAALNAELVRRDAVDDVTDRPPLSQWKADQMKRPVCIIQYRD